MKKKKRERKKEVLIFWPDHYLSSIGPKQQGNCIFSVEDGFYMSLTKNLLHVTLGTEYFKTGVVEI